MSGLKKNAYSGILFNLKKGKIMPYETIQMKCENSMLTEISQSQKDKYSMIPFIYKIVKVIESVSGEVVARG